MTTATAPRSAPAAPRRHRLTRVRGSETRLHRLAVWLGIVVLLTWSGLPLLWSFTTSLKRPLEVYVFRLFSADPSLAAYARAVEGDAFRISFMNSALYTGAATVATLALATFAAYAFARYAFRWRHTLLFLILIPMLVPKISLVIPLFFVTTWLGVFDTRLAVILVYTGLNLPLATWILVGFFRAAPKELEEAAAIDGATFWQRLTRVVLPLAIPGVLTAGVLCARENWVEFPIVLALTSGVEARSLPYQLFVMRDGLGIDDIPLSWRSRC